MASYNRVILMGNLTRDIELRYTPGGTPVTDAGLAINDRRKGPNGEWVDETTFVEVTFWGRTAEVASEYLSKGSPVFVEGRLKLDTWEKEGQKKSRLKVVCDRMQLVGGRGDGSRGPSAPRDEYVEAPGAAHQHSAAYQHSGAAGEPSTIHQPEHDAPSGPSPDEIPF